MYAGSSTYRHGRLNYIWLRAAGSIGSDFSGGSMTDLDRHFYRDVTKRASWPLTRLWHIFWLIPLVALIIYLAVSAALLNKSAPKPMSKAYSFAVLTSIQTGQSVYSSIITDKTTGLVYRTYLVDDNIFVEDEPIN
jgi:hypothetical protein